MDLRRVDRVPHIVPLPVRHERDEALGLAQLLADELHDVDVLHLVVSAHVIHFPHPSLVDDEVDRLAVVLHIQPVAHILPRSVYGQRLVRKRVRDRERDELLGEMIGPVVVGTARNGHGKSIRSVICEHQKIRPRLGGGIGAGRMQRRLLRKEEVGSVERQIAVHLVRRDLMIAPDAVLAAGIHQNGRADDVGLKEDTRVLDGAVDMALRREVDDDVGLLLLEEFTDRLAVADVRLHEAEVGVVHHAPERGQIARIGELIQTHDAVFGILFEDMKDKIAADEPRPAGDEDGHKLNLIKHPLYYFFVGNKIFFATPFNFRYALRKKPT